MIPDPEFESVLVWFRRDLRIDDHAALSAATRRARRVHCAFVFDRDILDALPDRDDRRVAFVHASVVELERELRRAGGALHTPHASARAEIPALAARLGVQAVFANRDYEPCARERDAEVERALARDSRALHSFKDQAVFDRDELTTAQGRPYSVYTPYRNAWLRRLSPEDLAPRAALLRGRLASDQGAAGLPTLAGLGFAQASLAGTGVTPGASGARAALDDFASRIDAYRDARDFPALDGSSRLSAHLRFGTVSIRVAAGLAWRTMQADPAAAEGAGAWLDELIWRDFWFQILHHHPRVVEHAFRPEYDRIRWSGDDARWLAWREGRTGYPLVDAAMTQLERTGWMHNRLRMVAASFLVKDLGVDWRLGERHFARKLLDFDLAANNGNWQWTASTGCDAQPWFRIFNPVTQSLKFDADGRFIRRWLPQLAKLPGRAIHAPWRAAPPALAAAGVRLGVDYPLPAVDHETARAETLARYAALRRPRDAPATK